MTDRELLEFVAHISRRRFLGGAAALAAAPFLPAGALAQASHSFTQGDFEITVVSDGTLTLPPGVLAPDATPEQLADISKRLGWTADAAKVQANVPLIKAGSDLILIDNGSGAGFQPNSGKLLENLKAHGVEPDAVTKVVFTHAHPDHIWGTLGAGSALNFPNATYYVGGAEWDFWMDPSLLSKVPAEMADFVKGAQRDLGAVEERVTRVKGGDEIVTGIRVLDTPGHTPGHISIEVAGGEGLIVTADSITNEVIFFEHPDWKFGFDADPDVAVKSRKALLDRAATDRIRLLGYHWAYPGVGMAEKKDNAYRFVAAT